MKEPNKKCSCVGTTYSHVKPEDRTHKMNNWKCNKCGHQFHGS